MRTPREISNIKAPMAELFWSRVRIGGASECWPWANGDRHPFGYGIFATYPDGKRVRYLAHRFAFFLANPETRQDLVVMHLCDNPPCVNPSHLTTGSQGDNIHDALSKGRLNMSGLDRGRLPETRREKIASVHPGWIGSTEAAAIVGISRHYLSRFAGYLGAQNINRLLAWDPVKVAELAIALRTPGQREFVLSQRSPDPRVMLAVDRLRIIRRMRRAA